MAPYCCLNHTITLPCTRTEISILKQKFWRFLIGKQIGTAQKLAGFQEPNTRISLPSFVLFSVCANFALSILFNDVCLFCVNQSLQHLWDEQQLYLYGFTTPQILIIHAELCFVKISTSFLVSNPLSNWLKHNTHNLLKHKPNNLLRAHRNELGLVNLLKYICLLLFCI